ncbi:hypothetical protein [Saccharopolyspora gregorii]|uniref:Uncharacterized protein n=1 Tax=Saccharopolyspora gregorii TaxID=33914 RepID=A0ABP6RVM9_9PSEU|nr:hypothetical protein [Saccharopolyspora gregorii]
MNEQNRHRNTMSGTSGRTVQVGAVHGDLTITDGRARRRLAVCAPLAAVALVLGTSPATTPAPAPPAPPPVAESSAPPPPWEVSSSGTGRGDTELSSRSGTPDGPHSGAECAGTGADTHCEVSSGVTFTPTAPAG